jgi:hypothetical protein
MRVASALLTGGAMLLAGGASAEDIDWQKVDSVFGRKAAVSADVHRYGFSRSDLTVTLDGVIIKPAFALGGWVASKGDLVLLEAEVNSVMTKLIENGIQLTAVHNHLLRANPMPFYMHVGGHGDAVKMANAIRTALAESKTPLEAAPSSVSKVGRMAGCTNSPCRAAKRSVKTESPLLRPARWESRPGSTFSRQAAARRRSPKISCSQAMRSIRSSGRCAKTESR